MRREVQFSLTRVGICVRIVSRYSSHSTCLLQSWWIAVNAARNAAFLRFHTVCAFVVTAAAGIVTVWVVNALYFVINAVLRLASTPFVIACIATAAIQPLLRAVRDVHSHFFELL